METAVPQGTDQASENLLQVVMGGENILLRSSDIREVVRPLPLTPVPMGPEHLLGLANIHGQVVCIIDAGVITALPACDHQQTSRSRYLVLRHPLMHVGIWVDAVSNILPVDKILLAAAGLNHDSISSIEIDGEAYHLLECSSLFERTNIHEPSSLLSTADTGSQK